MLLLVLPFYGFILTRLQGGEVLDTGSPCCGFDLWVLRVYSYEASGLGGFEASSLGLLTGLFL